ncbi:MAG: hypothetical protein LBT65_06100 [Synergistaceae bacterium]|jgi:FtsZ-binding cell division protein ZapB|nr:hypothetical protein [Synergistaceae bacterium]
MFYLLMTVACASWVTLFFLFIRYQDQGREGEKIRKEAEYVSGLQMRAINQLREENGQLQEKSQRVQMAAHDCVQQAKAAMEDLRAKKEALETELLELRTKKPAPRKE